VLVALLFLLVLSVASVGITRLRSDRDEPQSKVRNDINQLHEAVMRFETKTGIDHVPSRFVLSETQAGYFTGMNDPNPAVAQLYSDSYTYLNRVFNNRTNWNVVNEPPSPDPQWAGIDWNGDTMQSRDVILEGDQCLVFFLGGFSGDGFSNSPNPALLGGNRFGPFFDFRTSRLVDPGRAASPGYRVYIDAYGTRPYVYFSSYKVRNGYARYAALGSDCSLIPDGPYQDGNGNYWNRDSFQIISAGRDTEFGPGGTWSLADPAKIAPAGKDDMTNFAEKPLGVSQRLRSGS
jgi:hypothetical protein